MGTHLRSRRVGPPLRLTIALVLVLTWAVVIVSSTDTETSSSNDCSTVIKDLSELRAKVQIMELKLHYTDIRVQDFNRQLSYGTQSGPPTTTSSTHGTDGELQSLKTMLATLTSGQVAQKSVLQNLQSSAQKTETTLSTVLSVQNQQQGKLDFLISRINSVAKDLTTLTQDVRQLQTMVNGSRSTISVTQLVQGQNRLQSSIASLKIKVDQIYSNSQTNLPTSCKEVGTSSSVGVYNIWIAGKHKVSVYCDGNWTVIQRRMNGAIDFYRGWEDYRSGFGAKSGEYWLGLDWVYKMVSAGSWELQIDLGDWNGTTAYARYSEFSLGSAADNYTLKFTACIAGNAGDELVFHKGRQFSTKDRDNDKSSANCAASRHGAWWYSNCGYINLNGAYKTSRQSSTSGIFWWKWTRYFSLKSTMMKIRPA